MGNIVTDTTINPDLSKSITGYRSGNGTNPSDIKNTCDIRVTADDPFDFSVDWRFKTVKVHELRVTKSGRKYSYYTLKKVPYPYYVFVTKTRTVKEWRLELAAGKSVLRELPSDLKAPHIRKKYDYLVRRLQSYGKCRPTKTRSDQAIMHNCVAWESERQGPPILDGFVAHPYYSYQEKVTNGEFRYRFFEPAHVGQQYEGDHGSGVNAVWNEQFNFGCFVNPVNCISNNVSAITAMLWPDSADFEDIGSTPLIDIAEAVSDGVFPLGPPPDPLETYDRMNKSLNHGVLESMKDAIDFGANAHLWATLVLEPVIQSAVGLVASVEANDKAIEAYTSAAKSGKWIQGKRLRLYGANPQSASQRLGAPQRFSVEKIIGNSVGVGVLEHNFVYDKFEGNAHYVYKLDNFDASVLSTSGQKLGQFFNRLSSGLDDVLWNIVPLSFVYDWFSTAYSGTLDLKNKVYMPVNDWKLVVSHNVDVTVKTSINDMSNYFTKSSYYVQGWVYPAGVIQYITRKTRRPDVIYIGLGSNAVDGPTVNPIPAYTKTWYEQYFLDNHTIDHIDNRTERHKYYKRWVYNRPARMTNFDTYQPPLCLDTSRTDPLEDIGKQVTLGALIWGFIRG